MDTIGTETSLGLQYGVPLRVFVDKFSHTRFEPSGWTTNQEIPHAKSVVDYIFRWLGIQFIPGYREANTPRREADSAAEPKSDPKSGPVAAVAAGAATKNGASKSETPPAAVAGAIKSLVAPHGNGSNGVHSNGNGKHHPVATHDDAALDGPAFDGPQIRSQQFATFQDDAPACDNCGAITVRNGNCYLCHNCGNSMGCS
jgi:ribonucleoside-diphosphate reductase alpha chain